MSIMVTAELVSTALKEGREEGADAERAEIVAWLRAEGDDDNDADSALVDSVALRICSGLYPKCSRPEKGHCGTCQYAAKAGLRSVASAVERGEHKRAAPGEGK